MKPSHTVNYIYYNNSIKAQKSLRFQSYETHYYGSHNDTSVSHLCLLLLVVLSEPSQLRY